MMIFEAVHDLEINGIYPLSYLLKCTAESIIVLAWYTRRNRMEGVITQMPLAPMAASQRKGLQKRTEQLGGSKYAEHFNFSIDDIFDDETILNQIK